MGWPIRRIAQAAQGARAVVERGSSRPSDRGMTRRWLWRLCTTAVISRRAIWVAGVTTCLALSPPAAALADGGKIKIAFAGDSIVDNYWAGITRIVDANSCLKDV